MTPFFLLFNNDTSRGPSKVVQNLKKGLKIHRVNQIGMKANIANDIENGISLLETDK